VEGLSDLLEDDAALDLDLGLGHRRREHDVREDVEGERDVGAEHARIIGGHLAPRVGVDVAADILDLLGDLAGGAARGALEGHVLEEMGNAVLLDAFMAAAGGDPYPDGSRGEAGHRFGDDTDTVPQAMNGNGQVVYPCLMRPLSASALFST